MKLIRMAAAAAVPILFAAGCTRVSDLSQPTPTATPPIATPTGPRVDATIYYLTDFGGRIFLVPEVHSIVESRLGASQLEEMIAAVTQDPDLSSPWPEGTRILGVTIEHGLATVDFSAEVLNATGVGTATEQLGIQQAVHTLAALPGVQTVEFRVEGRVLGDVNGRRIEDWWGHAGLSGQPFTPDDEVLAPITIEEPEEGDTVPATITVSGEASVFEANVLVRLRAPDGSVAFTDNTTASIGAPERGTWSMRVTIPGQPGETWTIEGVEESAEDGSDAFVVTRKVVIAS